MFNDTQTLNDLYRLMLNIIINKKKMNSNKINSLNPMTLYCKFVPFYEGIKEFQVAVADLLKALVLFILGQ